LAAGLLGFRFVTPGSQIKTLEVRVATDRRAVDSTMQANRRYTDSTISLLVDQLEYTTRIIEALARQQCLQGPRFQTQLTGLPCTTLLQGFGRAR